MVVSQRVIWWSCPGHDHIAATSQKLSDRVPQVYENELLPTKVPALHVNGELDFWDGFRREGRRPA